MRQAILIGFLGFTILTQPLLLSAQSKTEQSQCDKSLQTAKEVIGIQQREIVILEDMLLDEKKQVKKLEDKLDNRNTWLWILPPLAILVGIFTGGLL